jgi:hypothetical protein
MGRQPGEQPDRAEVVNRAEEILLRSRGDEEEELRALCPTAVLHKPCTAEELAEALRQAMGAAPPEETAQ